MKKKAFTLVEILVVVVVLGILAAIVIPQFMALDNQFQATLSTPTGKKAYTFNTGDEVTIKDRSDMTSDHKRLPEGTYSVKVINHGAILVLDSTTKTQPGLNLTRSELENEAAYSTFDFKKKS